MNTWVDEGCQKGWLDAGFSSGNFIRTRLTSRMYGYRFVYPDVVLKAADKIRKYCGIDSYPFISGHGTNGIVVSCTMPGGDVYAHKDPRSKDDSLATLRCNVMTRDSDSGGELFVGGVKVDVGVGDLHCYLVSEHEHYVTAVEGVTPRVMWMFGAHVPEADWNSGQIKFGSGT